MKIKNVQGSLNKYVQVEYKDSCILGVYRKQKYSHQVGRIK